MTIQVAHKPLNDMSQEEYDKRCDQVFQHVSNILQDCGRNCVLRSLRENLFAIKCAIEDRNLVKYGFVVGAIDPALENSLGHYRQDGDFWKHFFTVRADLMNSIDYLAGFTSEWDIKTVIPPFEGDG